MKFYIALSTILFCSLGFAQTSTPVTTDIPTQKYNGYGLPNTKFKKVKVAISKQNKKTKTQLIAPKVLSVQKSALQPNNTVTKAITMKATASEPIKPFVTFGLDYGLSYNMQAQEHADHSRGEYYQHELNPRVTIGDYTILGDILYYDDIKDPSANEWQDSALLLSRKAWELNQFLTLSPHTLVVFPLSKASREGAGMKSQLGAGLTLGMNSKALGLEAWTLNYVIRYTKVNSEFETKSNGDPVTDYQIKQRINFGYAFTDKFSFKTRFEFNSNYSLQNVVRNSYFHSEVFNYDFTEHFSMNVGHGTSSGLFTIQETPTAYYLENDLKFYDPINSEVAIGIGLSI